MALPVIDQNQELLKSLHPIDDLPLESRKQRGWKSTYRIISISTPIPVNSPTIKKKFKIQFRYMDTATNKEHSCVVHFGTQTDYVYTGNKQVRMKKLTTMKNIDNPFRGNYWSSWIMNKCDTMEQGFKQLQDRIMQQNMRLGVPSFKVPKKLIPAKQQGLKKINNPQVPRLKL